MSDFANATPRPWLRDGNTIYALDETGSVNRFSLLVQGGCTFCGRNRQDRTTDEELRDTAALILEAVNAFDPAKDALFAEMMKALHEAAEYIGDESAGSMSFWRKYYDVIERAKASGVAS